MPKQLPLRELLREPQYRTWFAKAPTLRVVHHTPPWRLYVQQEEGGRWGKADLPTYPKAYTAVRSRLSECFDMTIHCCPQPFRPPIVEFAGKKSYMPSPEGHEWCVYCRRPTVFGFYSRHPAMPHRPLADFDLRCGICAARFAGMKRYKPKFSWERFHV